jgi:cell division septum initiation protein DivIVA
MTAIDSSGDVLSRRTDFDREWRGFSRGQVLSYVDNVEAELELLTADRDAAVSRAEELVRHLDQLRAQNAQLQERLDRVCRSPIEPDGLQDRLRRMVELAREESDEIIARAQAVAEDSWASAEQAAIRLRERYERLDGELDSYRHRVEGDFELAMAERRNEAMRAVAEQKAAATAEAERLVQDAREQASRLVAAARRQVEVLFEIRDRTADQLHCTRELLADAESALQSRPEDVMQSVAVKQVGEIPAARQPA